MSDRGETPNSVICNVCGIAYSLPEDEAVGNLPHVLLCSHIFCTACLRSLEFNNVILCPECKVESSLPEGGVDELQVDSRIIGLIYTARMNEMKSVRRVKPPSPVKEDIKQASDMEEMERELEEGLSQASENLAFLKNIHQTVAKALAVQVRKENSRLLMELDGATDRAFVILQRRKGELLGELAHMEQCFPASRRALDGVEERLRRLETAVQQARQVRLFPSLEGYCDLDQVLETLQAPVDVQSFDLSSLTPGSGLSFVRYPAVLGMDVKECLTIVTGNAKLLTEEVAPRPQQQDRAPIGWPPWRSHPPPSSSSSSGVDRSTSPPPPRPPSPREPPAPQQEQESPRMKRPVQGCAPRPRPKNTDEEQAVAPPRGAEQQLADERQGARRRSDTPLGARTVNQTEVRQTFVKVTHVVNPNHFYICYNGEKTIRQTLFRLIDKLCFRDRGFFFDSDILKTGCMVLTRKEDEFWCRATVTELFKRGDPNAAVPHCSVSQLAQVRVFCQDYGFSKRITLQGHEEHLYINKFLRRVTMGVRSEIFRLHPQAIKCSLKDIVPANPEKGWTVEARDDFLRVAGCEELRMHVFGEEGDTLLVDLSIAPDPRRISGDVAFSLRECLVFLELARYFSPEAGNAKTVLCGRRPTQFYRPYHPLNNLDLEAVVSHVNSPADFYIQLQADRAEYVIMKARMQSVYSRAGRRLEMFYAVPEQACVARFTDRKWYRAQVVGLPGGRQVEVRYVDFGNEQIVPVTDLRKIKNSFFCQPAAAIKCCLAGLSPLEGEDTWSEACTQRFKSLANQRQVVAVAKAMAHRSRAMPVRLFDTKPSGEKMADLGELLSREQLAGFRRGKPRESRGPVMNRSLSELPPVVRVPASAQDPLFRGRESPPSPASLGPGSASSSPASTSPASSGYASTSPASLGPGSASSGPASPSPSPPGPASPGPASLGPASSGPASTSPASGPASPSPAPPRPASPEPPLELQPSLRLPSDLKDLRVRVTHVVSPGRFYVQLAKTGGQLKRVCEQLKLEYAGSKPRAVQWSADMFCAAYNNGVWERGQIRSTDPSSSMAEVLRCDYGNKVTLQVSSLRPLSPALMGSMVLECALDDVRPAGGLSTWSATACELITYYLTGAMGTMTIKENTEERPVPVSLFCSNRAGQNVSMADFLVSEGLALRERKPRDYPVPRPEEEEPIEPQVPWDPQLGRPPSMAPPTSSPPSPSLCGPRPSRPPSLKELYCPPELPGFGHAQMKVCGVGEDGVVYARTQHAEHQCERLRVQLQQLMKTQPRLKPLSWRTVLGCVVMLPDALWYRGQVLEVNRGHVKVRCVDQGWVEDVPVCHACPALLCEDVPQLCVPCQLHGVTPVGGSWQKEAVALLKELLLNRWVDMQVKELPGDPMGSVTVRISLDGLTLSRILEHHQHASLDQESTEEEEEEHVMTHSPDLKDWDIDTEGVGDLEQVPGVFSYPRLPEKGERFRVEIRYVLTPNQVFLYPLGVDGDLEEGEGLEEALDRVNQNTRDLPELSDFPREGPCLAKYRDRKFYRAKLMGFAGLNPVKLLIRYVDFGSDDILPTHRLRQLPAPLLRFPCQAIRVRVEGLRAPRGLLEEGLLSRRTDGAGPALAMSDLLRDLAATVTATEPEVCVILHDAADTLQRPLVDEALVDADLRTDTVKT